MSSVKFFSVVMVVFLLAGCATQNQFSGPERPDSELGVLHVDDGLLVERINGKWRGVGLIDTYRFLPGVASVGVKANWGLVASGRLTLEFEAVAGEEYQLLLIRSGKNEWTAEIIELSSKTAVTLDKSYDKNALWSL
ncbi:MULTISPECIES: hypothetical protein [unclassified Marinobacter]|uniref:hypothetical protein n=1 Tax=unclassified Marinobacter TaxID=83889 RepID=UPI001928D64B|nr:MULTISPECIES: hypothetical protein [unclassified Marinobacter]MBL3824785.1 hypothetical protein [Marinobacter sp. MC3]MBL3893291.1 hypothetical protein [Marinobacter sp. MW3]